MKVLVNRRSSHRTFDYILQSVCFIKVCQQHEAGRETYDRVGFVLRFCLFFYTTTKVHTSWHKGKRKNYGNGRNKSRTELSGSGEETTAEDSFISLKKAFFLSPSYAVMHFSSIYIF